MKRLSLVFDVLRRTCRIPAARKERETGITLIEMMAVVAIMAIIGAPQINNFFIEKAKGQVSTAITSLNSLGTKITEYCDDNNQQCAGVTMAQLIAGGYLGNTVSPPLGGAYAIVCANGNGGNAQAACTITDPNSYSSQEVWASNTRNAAGNAWAKPAGPQVTVQLQWATLAGGVTTTT